MAAKIRNALVFYQPLTEIDGIEIRLHETTLYASIYRADNDLLINTHAYGITAAHTPVLHITHTQDNDMVATYLKSFNDVWHFSEHTAMPSQTKTERLKERDGRAILRALPNINPKHDER